jgi:hypothetical protein
MTVRRYYLLKRLAARQRCEEEGVWISKQEGQPGTALPSDFPFRSQLLEAGYSTSEDLEGATADELYEFAQLMARDAATVTAALAAL